jgi:deazaflavin-dependent oxidoreductase (nitroreductase family)
VEVNARRQIPVGSESQPIVGAKGLWIPIYNLPVILFRLGLGWLFCGTCLVVTHRGRRTGRVRRTPLAVVRYDAERQEATVLSVWGERAQWYRNLLDAEALEIWFGRRRYVPEQRFLTPEEVQEVLLAYNRQWPVASRLFAWMLGWPSPADVAANRRLAVGLRAVAFRPL